MDDSQAIERQKAHFERARKGVVQFLIEKGGQLPLEDLHDYSLNRYLIQHQAFSRLMESLVEEKLVEFDFKDSLATATQYGRDWLVQNASP